MKIFHHNDLDGRCAAAIVLQSHPDAECVEINYNQQFPIDSIGDDEIVYILDYSIQPDEMTELLKKTASVIWIDHHKTAIEKYKDFRRDVVRQRRTDHSGAWLTWDWFNPGIEPPDVVRLVDDWDMWTHEKNPNGDRTRRFVAGMKAHNTAPRGPIWSPLFATTPAVAVAAMSAITTDGIAILDYESHQNAEYIKAFGHGFSFEGHNCFACNQGIANSKLFDSADPGGPMPFSFRSRVGRVQVDGLALLEDRRRLRDSQEVWWRRAHACRGVRLHQATVVGGRMKTQSMLHWVFDLALLLSVVALALTCSRQEKCLKILAPAVVQLNSLVVDHLNENALCREEEE